MKSVMALRKERASAGALGEQGRGLAASSQSSSALVEITALRRWSLLHSAPEVPVHFCFSPHKSTGLSLNPVGAAIDQATSSVLF